MLTRTLFSFLLLVSGIAVVANSEQPPAPANQISVCAWVERFQILNRPTKVTVNDLDWIAGLPGILPPVHDTLEQILKQGDITTISQLEQIEVVLPQGRIFHLPLAAQTMIRVFFALEGDPACDVKNSPTGQSQSQTEQPGSPGASSTVEELSERITNVESQLTQLNAAVTKLSTTLNAISAVPQARLQSLQQTIDQLLQRDDETAQRLKEADEQMIVTRKSAQLGLLVGLVGVTAAVLIILKVL